MFERKSDNKFTLLLTAGNPDINSGRYVPHVARAGALL
jgi:hypothetical protein